MPEVKGVSRDAVHDMSEWNPISKSLEEQDEEERLKDKGGIEVGEKYKTLKKRGVTVGQEKVPGEVKHGAGEAVSREPNPLEKILAAEQGDTDEKPFEEKLDPVAVASAQEDIDEARARRRAEEAAAGWSPKSEKETAEDPSIPKRASTTEGVRKSVWQKVKDIFGGPRFDQPHKKSVEEGGRSIQTPKRKTEPFRGER